MQCTECGVENAIGNRYCVACGTSLAMCCDNCGEAVSRGACFCSHCGRRLASKTRGLKSGTGYGGVPVDYTPRNLAQRIPAECEAMQARGFSSGERKLVTVLFADLVDSTALVRDLDPEDARHVIDPVLALMMEAIHHFEGYVAKSLGDGILALFGAPVAQEDHGQRALYSALRMLEMLRRHNLDGGVELRVRVGVNSGAVVVRAVQPESLATDYDPIGHSVNLASRLEAIAEPGEILVSESTYRLTKDYFSFTDEGRATLKGIDEGVRVYRLQGPGPVGSRFGIARSRGLGPYIGRSDVLDGLCSIFRDTCSGRGQMVGIFGEPGIGKTRLIHEFKRRIDRPCKLLELSLSAYDRDFSFHCVLSLLRKVINISWSDDQDAIKRKLYALAPHLDGATGGEGDLLLSLMGLGGHDDRFFQLDAESVDFKIEVSITQVLDAVAKVMPVIALIDDLHLADACSLEFLANYSARLGGRKILVIVGARTDIMPDFLARAVCASVVLQPFDPYGSKAFLDALLGSDGELGAIKTQIVSSVSGNPLFLEEVVQSMREQGVLEGEKGTFRLSSVPERLVIPATVQSIMLARVDSLQPQDKTLVQLLAVAGMGMPVGLLAMMAEVDEARLKWQLERLICKAFVVQKPALAGPEFGLRHALIAQAAVESLLKEQRSGLHQRVGCALEIYYENHLGDQSSVLALHFLASKDAGRALKYLYMSAKRAQQGGLHADALLYVEKARNVLEKLERSNDNLQMELRLLLLAGAAWMAQKGFAAIELEAIYTRAIWLARHLDDMESLFRAVFGLRLYHFGCGRLELARDLALELVEMAQRAGDRELLMEARLAHGGTLFPMGRLREARQAMDEAVGIYTQRSAAEHSLRFGMDPGVTGLAMLGRVLWYLGYPDQAMLKANEAVTLARQLGSPYEQAFAFVFAAEVHTNCGYDETAIGLSAEAIELSGKMGFRQWLARAHILHGWCQARSSFPKAGRTEAFEWIEQYRQSGVKSWRALYSSYKSALLATTPALCEALLANAEGVDLARKYGEYLCLPELLRIQGVILSRIDSENHQTEILECLDEAMRLAGAMGAQALQLRVALERCRLCDSADGRPANLRQLLHIYQHFTEGSETRDIKRARLLLEKG